MENDSHVSRRMLLERRRAEIFADPRYTQKGAVLHANLVEEMHGIMRELAQLKEGENR